MLYTKVKYPDQLESGNFIITRLTDSDYRVWYKQNNSEVSKWFKSLEEAKEYVAKKEKNSAAINDSNNI